MQSIPWQSGYGLGMCVELGSGTIKPSPFASRPVADQQEAKGELHSTYREIEDISDVEEVVDQEFSFSGSGWGASVSVGMKNHMDSHASDYSYILEAGCKYLKNTHKWSPSVISDLTLSQTALSVSAEQWQSCYGDYVVIGWITGGEIYCSVKVHTSSLDQKREVSASLKGGYAFNASTAARIASSLTSFERHCKIDIKVTGTGMPNNPVPLQDLEKLGKKVEDFPSAVLDAPAFAILQPLDSVECVFSHLKNQVLNPFQLQKGKVVVAELTRLKYVKDTAADMQGLLIWKEDLPKLQDLEKEAEHALDILEQELTSGCHKGLTVTASRGLFNRLRAITPVKPPMSPDLLTDMGYGNMPRGWVDAQNQGVRYDYGRHVGPGPIWFSVAFAGSTSQYTPNGAYSLAGLISKPSYHAGTLATPRDMGYSNKLRGWFDFRGTRERLDYGRYVGPGPIWFSIATPGKEYTDNGEVDESDVFSRGGPAEAQLHNVHKWVHPVRSKALL